MPAPERWTSSMLDAWRYAVSAIEHGMTSTAGLLDYRGGGGIIRSQDWHALSGLAREAQATGDLVAGQPWETPIPGAAYTVVDLDYGHEYVAVADVSYEDLATGKRIRRTVTIESDEIVTWRDLEAAIQEVVDKYGVVGGAEAVSIERVRLFTPSWIKEW